MSGRRFANARAMKPGPGGHMMPPMVEYVTVNSLGVNFGFLGFDYAIPDYIQVVDFEDHRIPKSHCGFSRNVLGASSSSYQTPSYQPRRQYRPSPPQSPTPKPTPVDCAERAAELLAEEEKAKEKAEKRRIKRSKQKERKRLEKLKEEQQNPVKNVKVNNVSSQPNAEESKSVNEKSNKTSASKEVRAPPPPQYWSDISSSEDSSEEEDEDEDDGVYFSSEELDMTSSFVSKAAEIAKRKLQQKATRDVEREKKQSATNQLKEKPKEERKDVQEVSPPISDIEYIIQRSKELAVTGNEFAAIGRYDVAVKYFTAAIKCNPTDFRLFCNRAFCYEKMQHYDKALADAELALSMSPQWLKGLFRKARALAGLKRYDEAVKALQEVLKQDPSSVDAAKELMTVQITQLMSLGFSREQSSNALIIHDTVEASLKALSKISGSLNMNGYPAVAQPVAVGGAHNTSGMSALSSVPPRLQQVPQRFYNNPTHHHTPPTTASNNQHDEIKLYPIWVGNLVPSVTEAALKELFETAGHVYSMKILWAKRCAFINYIDPDCCENARTLHGTELDGVKISVRYPDRIPTHLSIAKDAQKAEDIPVSNTKECYFWRNMGCNRRPSCPYRHIPEHHGIDRGKGKSSAQ